MPIPNRGQQVSDSVHEKLKQSVFLFHHRLMCTLDLEVKGVQKVHKPMGQKKLEGEYEDPEVLHNRDDGSQERIPQITSWCSEGTSCLCHQKEHGFWALWQLFMVCNSWWWNDFQDLHLPREQKRIWTESMAHSRTHHTTVYQIDSRTVYDIWIRSARTQTCIFMSNSISSNKIVWHSMLSMQGG